MLVLCVCAGTCACIYSCMGIHSFLGMAPTRGVGMPPVRGVGVPLSVFLHPTISSQMPPCSTLVALH